MDASVYQIISYIGFGLAILFFIIAVVLFFAFDVVALYGEVSGKTADKQVKAIREQNRRVSTRRREPEKSGRLEKSSKQIAKGIFESQGKEKEEETEVLLDNQESRYKNIGETVVLDEGETTVLSENEGTVLLEEGTTLLQEDGRLILLEDEVEIHTDEII